jgi:hypothetical protein
MTICHVKQEDEKELVFKFGFVGGFEKTVGRGRRLRRPEKTWIRQHISVDL